MVGAGALISLLMGIQPGETYLGMSGETAKIVGIVVVGMLMTIYVSFGGMKGTTWVQIIKAIMLMTGAALLVLLTLSIYGFNFGSLMNDAAEASGRGAAFLEPGLRYGVEVPGDALQTMWNKLDLVSLGMALVLGTAGLPHILIRFYTVPDSMTARKSVNWAIGLIGTFYLFTLVLGFGAAAIVGPEAVRGSNASGNTAVPLLALDLGGGADSTGGTVLFAVVAAVAFATILAVVAGITLASSASVAHDLYASFRRRHAEPRSEVAVARAAAVGIGVVAIALSLLARDLNVAFLVGLAFAVAASANLPVLLYSLFWRDFTTRGAVWAVYGGLVPALALVVLSPVVSGSPESLFPTVDFQYFPLQNPGLVSIPLGFLSGWLGTVTSAEVADEAKHAEIEVRSLTGAGAA
jgi:cation/acetate symporter